MKKSLLFTLALAAAMPAMADLGGNGYYRVENYKSERYVSIVDNRGSIDFVATSADLAAITLWKNFDDVCHDAATVLYVKAVGGSYQIEAQGTGIYQIIDHYLKIEENGSANGEKLYMAYGTYNGVVRYLGEANVMKGDEGAMGTNCTGDWRKWYIKPITEEGANYFGVLPDVSADGKLYTTLYTSFPYSAYSPGMKFYKVARAGYGLAVLEELTGEIPAATPVIVCCEGEVPSENRLKVGGEYTAITDNQLTGVYFCCNKSGHLNRVAYDPSTMRVLGRCQDGSLGFITADLKYIPANTTYLTVEPGSEAEIKLGTNEEYEFRAGLESGISADSSLNDIYSTTGVLVKKNATKDDFQALPAGMYIVGGKKIIKK